MNGLASVTDLALLRPQAGVPDIDGLCQTAITYGFFGVCVHPFWVTHAKTRIGSGPTRIVTVVGFPLGLNRVETKIEEAIQAITDGADEIDIVINPAFACHGLWTELQSELSAIIQQAKQHRPDVITKAILETGQLSLPGRIQAAHAAVAANADFVKTSTGFGPGVATLEDVSALRSALGPIPGIKASGGIRTAADATQLLSAGATRLGLSAGLEVIGAR